MACDGDKYLRCVKCGSGWFGSGDNSCDHCGGKLVDDPSVDGRVPLGWVNFAKQAYAAGVAEGARQIKT